MEQFRYPSFILYLILLIGIPLAIKRPFKAFIMIAFLFAAADAKAFTFTRTPFLGPYFNVNDACLLIALTAMLCYTSLRIKEIQFPNVTKWILLVLLIGFVQSWYVMGWTYEVLRALRWAVNLPVYFIIAATMVDKEEKIKPLLIALFLGSVVSTFEHFTFIRSRIDTYGEYITSFRSIAFLNPGVFFVIASIIWIPKLKTNIKIILTGASILFITSILLNQTRSIWFSTVVTLPVALMLFRPKNVHIKLITWPFILTTLSIAILLSAELITPEVNLINMIIVRLQDLASEYHTFTRLLAFELEINAWLKGTLIFGRGLFFFSQYTHLDYIAWGHLGHVSTLSQLGIIGLVVYSFYLPLTIIKASRKLWIQASGEVKYFGLFAGGSIIWYWICFFMSNSFLSQHVITGIIFGTVWRQAVLCKSLVNMNQIHEIQQ
jgi:hypothetical protein